MPPRVVITGLGPVTSIGVGAQPFHAAQLAGVSGARRMSFDGGALVLPVGRVDLPDHLAPSKRQVAATDRCTQLAMAAAHLALDDAGIDPATLAADRVGVVVGTGIGGAETWEESGAALLAKGATGIRPRAIPKGMSNNAAASVAIGYGFTGPSSAPVLACASGAEALVAAYQMIVCGEADVVLAGGTEAPLVPTIAGGFAVMRALSRTTGDPAAASRPFAADRDGFVLAEGAAVLVVESAAHAARRGATVLAEFAGYGRTTDAFHITMPHTEGDGATRAIERALRHAELLPEDVSWVNAHGTATAMNDAAEARALSRALGASAATVPVTSTKSQTGHALGAAGAIEAVASIQAIMSDVVPAGLNLNRPDPAFDLDLVAGDARELKVTNVLSNSFAFGGHNVVLAFARP